MVRYCLIAALVATGPGWTQSLNAGTRTVTVSGKAYGVRVVEVPATAFRLRVGLAQGRVGAVSSLAAIAQRYGAVAAINGCFFDAYSGLAVRNPHHTLIVGGQVVHRGDVGCLLGIWPDGRARIAGMKTRLCGSLDGSERWPNNWYAYWLNRLPENATTVTIFTPQYCQTRTPGGGTQVVVRQGVVRGVGAGSQAIPADGYVIYFRGAEAKLADRFRVGRRCAYRVSFTADDGSGGWGQVQEGMGCFPHLIRGGQIAVGPQTVVRSKAGDLGNRSGLGIRANGNFILATAGAMSLTRWAEVLRALGCRDALNLDGGASSGLYANGKLLTTPGRQISNALVVVRR